MKKAAVNSLKNKLYKGRINCIENTWNGIAGSKDKCIFGLVILASGPPAVGIEVDSIDSRVRPPLGSVRSLPLNAAWPQKKLVNLSVPKLHMQNGDNSIHPTWLL